MQRRVILILGKTGSGKSTLAKKIIATHDRVVVFDPLSEYHGGLVLESFNDLVRYFETQAPDSFFLVCRFRGATLDETEQIYDYAARACDEIGNLLVVIEEAEMFLNSRNEISYINNLISFGRHRGISILAIGRRPVEIAIRIRAQFTSIFSFRQTEPRDLQYLEAWGFSSQELQSLDAFQFATVGEAYDSATQAADYVQGE